jgi:hypothetical protein
MSPAEADACARAINAKNAKRTRRAESAVEFILALVLAVLGALALLHWLTPCDVGHLCAGGAALVPTRTESWPQRLVRAVRRWYLRRLISAAEFDADFHAESMHLAPQLRDIAEARAAELRAELEALQP